MIRFRLICLVVFVILSTTTTANEKFECLLKPEMVTELGAAVPGLLSEVTAKRGDLVKEGEVVARLVSEAEAAAVEVAETRANGRANLESAKLRVEFNRRKYERLVALSKKNHLAEKDLDEAETERELSKKAVAEAEEAIALAKAELKRAKATLALKTVKSPYDGVVVDRYMNPGERVDEQPILKIAKLDPLYVDVLLPINKLGSLKTSGMGTITAESSEDLSFAATITAIDRVVDPASGLFNVRLTLPNPEYQITAGLECVAEFE